MKKRFLALMVSLSLCFFLAGGYITDVFSTAVVNNDALTEIETAFMGSDAQSIQEADDSGQDEPPYVKEGF